MADASIPVNLRNPGQVFACLGFLEIADVLLGDAEGGFDWSHETDVQFRLVANGEDNPFGVVLGFLANASIRRLVPPGYDENDSENAGTAEHTDTFPAPAADENTLPIRLVGYVDGRERSVSVSHWADGSDRSAFKLYSGNRSAAKIAQDMLGDTLGLRSLWLTRAHDLIQQPFDVLTRVGGSFNFDPRGAWTGMDAGYSPNDQDHGVAASPLVEMLSAIGLEHTRPHQPNAREVRYATWSGLLPLILARPAVGGADLPFPRRCFVFELALSGKNKVVTFAQEQTQP